MKVTQVFLFLSLVCFLEVADVSCGCSSGRYGRNCTYDCHCGESAVCDEDTGCNGNCAEGWFGDACQARNVALKRPVRQSPGTYCETKDDGRFCGEANYAVDGIRGHDFYRTPCSHAGERDVLSVHAEWSVTLDQVYNIYRFIIYKRGSYCCKGRLNGFVVSVGQTSAIDYNYRECYRDTTEGNAYSSGPGDVVRGQCSRPLRGDVVQIKQRNFYPLALCEVLVYICGGGWYGEECNKECTTTTKCARCDNYQIQCLECVVGKWGEHCESSCHCLNGSACVKDSGRCPNDACAAGFKGFTCQTDCSTGEFGSNCLLRCGHCRDGRSACNIKTGLCPDTTPRCVLGYRGVQCKEECPEGQFGADCMETCGQCSGGQAQCERFTGNCPDTQPDRCQPGWYGSQCTTECPEGQYAADCTETCGQCFGGQTQCDKVTGNCPDTLPASCQAGWSGLQCKTECGTGWYGDECNKECTTTTNCVRCDNYKIQCLECVVGKWGEHCESECHCLNGSACMKDSGRCPNDECAAGFKGFTCQTACSPEEHGANCEFRCGFCRDGNTVCNVETGHCPDTTPRCARGYRGPRCNEECPEGQYGADCTETCGQCFGGSTQCGRVTGSCPDTLPARCQAGWSGLQCRTECQEGQYGTDCMETCGQCSGGHTQCDRVTGNCPDTLPVRCQAGWSGVKCQTECGTGWYGEECNKECTTTTNCVRCDNYQVQCLECVGGKWGEHCESLCHCLNESACMKDSGRCPNDECAQGFKGFACQTVCSPEEHGANCEFRCGFCRDGNTVCNVETGHCPDTTPRCARGFRGLRCIEVCPEGQYGADCTETCGQCSGGRTQCGRVTGNCPDTWPARCQAGWSGVKCKTGCEAGNWGEDCKFNCSAFCTDVMKCNIVNGSCVGGCNAGYTGDKCESESLTVALLTNSAGVIAGITLTVAAVVAMVIVALVLWRRRVRNNPQNSGNCNQLITTYSNIPEAVTVDEPKHNPETNHERESSITYCDQYKPITDNESGGISKIPNNAPENLSQSRFDDDFHIS